MNEELEQTQAKIAEGQTEIRRVDDIIESLELRKIEIEREIILLKSDLAKQLVAKYLGNLADEPDALRNKIQKLNVELEEMPLLKAGLEHYQLNIKKDLSGIGPKVEKLSAVARYDELKKELFEQSQSGWQNDIEKLVSTSYLHVRFHRDRIVALHQCVKSLMKVDRLTRIHAF